MTNSISVELVKFRGEYYCLDEVSYNTLLDRQVSVFRISESTLELLKTTLLRGIKIVVYPWSQVYPQLRDRFISKLPKEGVECKFDSNWIVIGIDKSSLDDNEVKECERYIAMRCDQMQDLIGRYGIRTTLKQKDKDHFRMFRLEFTPDENILPSFFFGVNPKSPLTKHFYLSSACRIEFTQKESVSGERLIHVAFEDKQGENWSQTVVRSFPVKGLKAENIKQIMSMFINMYSTTTRAIKATPEDN